MVGSGSASETCCAGFDVESIEHGETRGSVN
jgi:hypothetical protein